MRIFSKKLPHPDLVNSISVDKILSCYIESLTNDDLLKCDVWKWCCDLSCIYCTNHCCNTKLYFLAVLYVSDTVSRKGCELFQRNSSGLFQVKSIVRRTLLFQGRNKNPVIKSVLTNHQDNFWVERKSKQQHFLSTCRRQKRRRLCWWLTSIRSRCPSPPSCFWPSTCRLPRCTRTRRSSSSSLKFLSSTSSTSSMAAQRRFVPNIKAYVLFQRCFTDSCQ